MVAFAAAPPPPPQHILQRAQAGQMWSDFQAARRLRSEYDLVWWTCHQWSIGNTDVFFDRTGGGSGQVYRVKYGEARNRRLRPINWIGPAIDGVVGKRCRVRPTFHVSPTSPRTQDRLAARAARDWVRWFWQRERLTGRRREMELERARTGNGFAKVYFDPNYGPTQPDHEPCPDCQGRGMVSVEDTELPLVDFSYQTVDHPCPTCRGTGKGREIERALGDVRCQFVPPWEVYPIPGSTSLDFCPGLFHGYRMTAEAAASAYGLDINDIVRGPQNEVQSEFDVYASMPSGSWEDPTVWVLEKWLQPLPGSKRPRLAIAVGGVKVFPADERSEAEVPERWGRIPFVQWRWRPTPGRFFAEGVVIDQISANDTVNRLRSLMHHQALGMSHDKWFAQAGMVNFDQLRNVENEVVEVFGPEAPVRRAGSPMPEYVNRLLEQEKENIFELAHLRQLDRGVAPTGVEAAQALSILAETGDTPQGGLHVEDEIAWAELARLALICARENYGDEERFIRIVGEGSNGEVMRFLKSDITDNIDVYADLGSALDHSLALRRADVLNAWNAQLLTDPNEAMRLLEFGTTSDGTDAVRLQEAAAEIENEEIRRGVAEGAPESPHAFDQIIDDHEVHLRMHREAAVQAKAAGNFEEARRLAAAAFQHQQALAQMQGPPQGQPGHQPAAPSMAGAPWDKGPVQAPQESA